jgi:hypothetical protein
MENQINEIKKKRGRKAIVEGLIVSKSPEYVKVYNKNFYEMNKEHISEYNKKKSHCDCCNKDLSISNFSKHCKSKKHVKNKLKNISINDNEKN